MNRAADNSELGEVRTQLGLAVLAVLAQDAFRSNTPRTKKTSNESLVSSIRL
jgi:hypothetical protein